MHILFYNTNIETKVIAPHTYFSTVLSGSLQPNIDLSFRYGNVSPVPHHETFIIYTLKESTASPTRHFPVFAETHHLSCRILFLSFLLLVLKKSNIHKLSGGLKKHEQQGIMFYNQIIELRGHE